MRSMSALPVAMSMPTSLSERFIMFTAASASSADISFLSATRARASAMRTRLSSWRAVMAMGEFSDSPPAVRISK